MPGAGPTASWSSRCCSSVEHCCRSSIVSWSWIVRRTCSYGASSPGAGSPRPRCARSWQPSWTGRAASLAPTMCSTTPDRRTRSSRRSRHSTGATGSWPRNCEPRPDRGCGLNHADPEWRVGAECRIFERRHPVVIRYEHPLNERIRTLMRLEDLYGRALFFANAEAPADHHAALLALFEISDVAARADLKTDILQELERQRQLLAPLKDNPAIERATLDALLSEIDDVNARLLAQTGKVGAHLRENEWLMAIKQRTGIPGGVCEFDLPAYHYWLQREPASRQRDLQAWLAPLMPILSGLTIILRLLRENGKASRHTAYRGVFQLMLTTAKVAQLLRLTVALDLPCVPEISANKYALNIRFLGIAGMDRGSVYEGDVEFDLMFCNL